MNIKKNIGVNDPCYCGSKRKYKKCCLRKDEEKQQEMRKKLDILTTDGVSSYLEELGVAPLDNEFLTWLQKDINEGANNLKEYENKLALTAKI